MKENTRIHTSVLYDDFKCWFSMNNAKGKK